MRNPLPVMLGIAILALSCFAICDAADMNKPKSGWANVPGGTVWLNPGDAYEHNTGLVRAANGQKRYPTTPQSMNQSAPAQPYVQPYHQPYVMPAQPVYTPQPQPYYSPPYVHPQYAPQPYYAPPYDTGRYCPNCPDRFTPRPYSVPWGVQGAADPMDIPKTGDTPVVR